MAPQDNFIDDEEDTCPLCIEEFDLSDRNFRPCPCGYQICQFCYNNLKNNLNGLCPACRRPYDEKDIQWKVVTHEEETEFRANIQKNQKKRATEQRQKEVQKREAEKDNRKNLQGVRVVQKNLVYVTGLTPTVREDELLKTLRKPEFFGQYGNIQKISISNRKSSDGQSQSLGIYVTFEKKEDAARCIQAVHGSQNGDRILKAQLGTTKYCSAWLRHEQCGNRQCMFLHELGDEEDSYSRQDLSSLNSVHTQRPMSSAASTSRAPARQHAPTTAAPPPAASQPMARTSSKEGSDAGDGPALPASANWARTNQQRSRRGSHATSGAASSPAISTSLPATVESAQSTMEPASAVEPITLSSRKSEKQPANDAGVKLSPVGSQPAPAINSDTSGFNLVLKKLAACPDYLFGPPKDVDNTFPPLFDPTGGKKRRAMREEEERHLAEPEEQVDNVATSEGEPESGSLALGGEPEDREQSRDGPVFGARRNVAQPPIQRTGAGSGEIFGPSLSGFSHGSAGVGSVGSRTMTPQQQIFMRPQGSFVDQMPPGITTQQSSLFPGHGHSRNQSRFSFANDNSSSSINVKSTADPRYMAQQSSMMPSAFRQPGNQMFGTSVSGPPPGLKSTGTPPVSGGMFGQGHSFGGSAFGAASKDNSHELLNSLIRGRGAGSSQAHDAGKLDLADPSILQARMQHQQQGNNTGVGQGLFGGHTQDDDLIPLEDVSSSVDALVSDSYSPDPPLAFLRNDTRTPLLPPGLGLTHAHPAVQFGERVPSPAPQVVTGPGPVRPKTPAAPRPVTPLVPKSASKSTTPGVRDDASAGDSSARKNIKELAAKSGLSKDIAAQASKSAKGKGVLQEEDFPALDTAKTSSPPKVTPALPSKPAQPVKAATGKKTAGDSSNKKTAGDSSNRNNKSTNASKNDKRPMPGALDIAAATKTMAQKGVQAPVEESDKSASTQSQSAAVQPAKSHVSSALPTPTTASISSPLARAAPKTLRLVQTPRSEAPSVHIPPAAAASIRSAGIGMLNHRPATPASEAISDTASIVSASVSASRTSSPPPSKIGSASVRATTKSQQRKQRKEASKEAAAQLAESKIAEEEVEIAPILGRKKKQKKEKKTTSASRSSTRPASPIILESQATTTQKPSTITEQVVSDGKPSGPLEDPSKGKERKGKEVVSSSKSPEAVDTSIRLNESTKTTVLTPDFVSHTPEVMQEQPVFDDGGEKPTWPQVLHTLIENNELPELEQIGFFKTSQGYRTESASDRPITVPPTLKSIVTKDDEEKLIAFQPVFKSVNDHTVLLTPNGDCLLGLTEEEADLFLKLQDRLRADSVRPTAFSAPRYTPATGFSLLKNRAVPNGKPSFFPSGPDNYPSDPLGKMHREEAIGCINQHVLPSLNLGNYKSTSANSNITKNLNLQQLAPWIYPSSDPEDQRKMLASRSGEDGDGPYASYDNPEAGPSPAIGSTPIMSVEEAEAALIQAKKAHDILDKKFRQLQARNRRQYELS